MAPKAAIYGGGEAVVRDIQALKNTLKTQDTEDLGVDGNTMQIIGLTNMGWERGIGLILFRIGTDSWLFTCVKGPSSSIKAWKSPNS